MFQRLSFLIRPFQYAAYRDTLLDIELHGERQAVVRRLPLFSAQDGCQTLTLLNSQCSDGLLALISAPTIVVA